MYICVSVHITSRMDKPTLNVAQTAGSMRLSLRTGRFGLADTLCLGLAETRVSEAETFRLGRNSPSNVNCTNGYTVLQ